MSAMSAEAVADHLAAAKAATAAGAEEERAGAAGLGVFPTLNILIEARRATEDTLRVFDNKAQVAGVSMILSVTAFATLAAMILPARAVPPWPIGLLLCVLLLVSVSMFAWVLWPASVSVVTVEEGGHPVQSTFYFPARGRRTLDEYCRCIENTDWVRELAYEIMKLSDLRNSKARRFQRATICAAFFYLTLVASTVLSLVLRDPM